MKRLQELVYRLEVRTRSEPVKREVCEERVKRWFNKHTSQQVIAKIQECEQSIKETENKAYQDGVQVRDLLLGNMRDKLQVIYDETSRIRFEQFVREARSAVKVRSSDEYPMIISSLLQRIQEFEKTITYVPIRGLPIEAAIELNKEGFLYGEPVTENIRKKCKLASIQIGGKQSLS